MAAEIASMVQTEQIDGLRMMSIDPVDYTVRPKALAMIFAVPKKTRLKMKLLRRVLSPKWMERQKVPKLD